AGQTAGERDAGADAAAEERIARGRLGRERADRGGVGKVAGEQDQVSAATGGRRAVDLDVARREARDGGGERGLHLSGRRADGDIAGGLTIVRERESAAHAAAGERHDLSEAVVDPVAAAGRLPCEGRRVRARGEE